MKAFGDRLLVRLDEPDAVSPGGIVIPEQARGRVVIGTVESVGSAVRSEKLAEGARVILLGEYAGAEISKNFIAVVEEEILAVVEG
jgi:co-chaperonin GroES (HSP10)